MKQHGNFHSHPVYHISLQGCSFPCWSYLPGIQPALSTVSVAFSQTLWFCDNSSCCQVELRIQTWISSLEVWEKIKQTSQRGRGRKFGVVNRKWTLYSGTGKVHTVFRVNSELEFILHYPPYPVSSCKSFQIYTVSVSIHMYTHNTFKIIIQSFTESWKYLLIRNEMKYSKHRN